MCHTKAKFPIYLRLLYRVIVSHISYLNFLCSTRPILKLGIIQLTMCSRLLLLVCRSVSKIGEIFWFYMSCTYWSVIYPFFWLCHPFVEWYICAVWCITVARCMCGGSCLDTERQTNSSNWEHIVSCIIPSFKIGRVLHGKLRYDIWDTMNL